MESETLVSLSLTTKFNINIYSSKIIDQYYFYTQTLRESGVDVILKYNNGDQDVFNINDLLDCMSTSPTDHIHYFSELHGREFNSDDNFKIFDLIDEAYNDRFGFSIKDGPVFQKYNELFRKVKIVERQTSELWKQFTARSKTKVAQFPFGEKIDESYSLLQEPHKNEKQVVENLEFVMSGYRKIQLEEKEEKQKQDEIKKKKEEEDLRKHLTIKKNQFGQFVYDKYNLVFDPKEKCIVGVSNKMGGFYPLDYSGVQLCERLRLKYKIVNEQKTFN